MGVTRAHEWIVLNEWVFSFLFRNAKYVCVYFAWNSIGLLFYILEYYISGPSRPLSCRFRCSRRRKSLFVSFRRPKRQNGDIEVRQVKRSLDPSIPIYKFMFLPVSPNTNILGTRIAPPFWIPSRHLHKASQYKNVLNHNDMVSITFEGDVDVEYTSFGRNMFLRWWWWITGSLLGLIMIGVNHIDFSTP